MLGSKKRWEEIGLLFESQGGRCAYTGDQIVLGEWASLDHIVPSSKNGSNDISNLQWVTFEINAAKSNMSHAEFVEMCCKVAALHGPKSKQASQTSRFVDKTSLVLIRSARASEPQPSKLAQRFPQLVKSSLPRSGSKDLDYSKVSGG